MKYVYIGNTINKNGSNNKKGVSIAGNKMQVGIVKGLHKILGNDLRVLTVYPIAAYPKEKDIFIKRNILKITERIESVSISFVNILGIKQITQVLGVFIELKNIVKNNDEKIKLICFNAFPYTALPTIAISKIYKLDSICILADLPIEVIKRNFLGKVLRCIDTILCKWCIKQFDKLIVLNEEAIKTYANDKPYIVIDGGFDIDDMNDIKLDNTNKRKIEAPIMLYSGALIEYNGIKNLVEAVKRSINKNYTIEIYGDGPLKDYVDKESKYESRIKYMGNIPNDDMMKRQKEVDFLINPRPVNDLVSKVTFPSKIIEYMLSGTPVITTKLNGLTKDYNRYLNYFDGDSIEALSNGLDKITNKDYNNLLDKSIKGQTFIINNKNWDRQCEVIYEFIK